MIEALRIEFDVRFAEGQFKGMGFPDDPDAKKTYVMTDVVDYEELGLHTGLEGMRLVGSEDVPCTYKVLFTPKEEVLGLYTVISKGDAVYHQR